MDEALLLQLLMASVSIGALVGLVNYVITIPIKWQIVTAAGIGFALGLYLSSMGLL